MIKDLINMGTKSGHEAGKQAKESIGDLYFGMNDLFSNFLKDFRGISLPGKEFMPKSDISETEKEIEIKLELPGIDEKDVDVSVENNVLTITGEKKQEEEIKKKNYHVSERSFGKFERAFTLPDYVDTEKINAKFKNGVLDIHIPKTKAASEKARKITVSKE